MLLCCIVIGTIYSHYMLGNPQEKIMFPVPVLFLLLIKIYFLLSGTVRQRRDDEIKKEE